MELKTVTLYQIKIPFKQSFKHASALRTYAENIVIRCEDTDGTVGWGETIPREYVTGETIDGTRAIYKKIPVSVWRKPIQNIQAIKTFLTDAGLDGYNVARCGLEIAILDLLSRREKKPLFQYLADTLPDSVQISNTGPFFYGGAIGLASPARTVVSALKMRLFNFRKVKLKLEKDLSKDRVRLQIVRGILGKKPDLRVDANEAWDMEYALEISLWLKRAMVSAVEQPFPKDNLNLNKEFREKCTIPIILDESLCSEQDARYAVDNQLADIFCIKLPKNGGFLRALKICSYAAKNSISIQLSCQVGESAILSAASRHLAALCPNLRFLEGSFDRYLLRENISNDDISFGYGGKADLIKKPGLGIVINTDHLKKLTVQSIDIFQ